MGVQMMQLAVHWHLILITFSLLHPVTSSVVPYMYVDIGILGSSSSIENHDHLPPLKITPLFPDLSVFFGSISFYLVGCLN
jgi:hypothetical protein